MARMAAGLRAALVASNTIPAGSLYAPAGNRLILRQVTVFNTTATGVVVALQALTTAGTQGAGIVEIEYDNEGPTPTGTVFNSHTGAPTITTGEYERATLAAAIGAGIVWTFDDGIYVPAGVANGVGVTTPTGTGQILDISFTWDE